jgi:hypothetical protein
VIFFDWNRGSWRARRLSLNPLHEKGSSYFSVQKRGLKRKDSLYHCVSSVPSMTAPLNALPRGRTAIEKKRQPVLVVMVVCLCSSLLLLVREQGQLTEHAIRCFNKPSGINNAVVLLQKNPNVVDDDDEKTSASSSSSLDDNNDDEVDRPYLILHMGPKKVQYRKNVCHWVRSSC